MHTATSPDQDEQLVSISPRPEEIKQTEYQIRYKHQEDQLKNQIKKQANQVYYDQPKIVSKEVRVNRNHIN